LTEEKAMLGFYISGHPLDKYRDELGCFTTASTARLKLLPDGREVTVGGIITSLKKMLDKKQNMMAFATLEDFSGGVELVLFSTCYEKGKDYIDIDKMVLVEGRINTREGEAAKIIANEVLPLEKLTERFNCQLVIKIDEDCSEEILNETLSALEKNRGKMPVLLAARSNGSVVYIKSKKYAVAMDFKLLNRLKELLGDTSAFLRPIGARNLL
jgi:DNA polymerase-3 subunit alpha